jgi:hypothetical protein
MSLRRMLGALALLLAAVCVAAPASASVGAHAARSTTPASQPAAELPQLHFGVRLVDVPVDEANNPRAFQYIIDFLPTGSVIHRRIMIINQEPRAARFRVYPAAAQIVDGVFIGGAGHARNELTGWITVRHPTVTLGPGQSVMDLVTIRVPRNATRAEHYAVIWAEQSQLVRASKRVTIRDVARVGIRVYLAVGRGGVPPTKFIITSLTGQRTTAGQPVLIVAVRDTGGRAVDLAGRLRLTAGPGDSTAGPFTAQRTVTLAPGQTGSVTFVLPARLPNGPWLATVTLASGLTAATARGSVTFGLRAVAASWASPVTLAWGGGMLLGLLVIATAVVARLWRVRRSTV